jgi:hypothetical protein
MRHRFAVGIVAGLVSLVGAGSVLADSTVITDPEGDATSNNLDIVAAKAGHAPGGVLKHRVTLAKKINPNDMGPNLHIDVPGGGSEAEYIVRPMESGVGPGPMRGGVFANGAGKVGKATITAVGENGFKYKFRERAIGKPKRYGWAWIVAGGDGEVLDRAPDAGFVEHRP